MAQHKRLGILGQVRPDRLQGHRDILAALRSRDPDAVERAFRHNAVTSVDLLLGDLD